MNVAAWTGRAGLAPILVGIGWYGLLFRWASARKWKPLDVPVSLSPGHIRTPEFEINTQGMYRIAFRARGGFGHQPGPSDPDYCQYCYQYCLPNLGASWSLSNRGKVATKDAGQWCDSLGEFEAGPGRYILDVHLSQDGSRFDASNPRLAVFEAGGLQEATEDDVFRAFWGLLVLATLGTGAILCSAMLRGHEKLDSFRKAWPLTLPESQLPPRPVGASARVKAIAIRKAPITAEYYMGDPRPCTRRPLTGLPSISLLAVLILIVLVMVSWYFSPRPPVGLKLRLLRPAVAEQIPGIQPVTVQVRFDQPSIPGGPRRPRPSLYVNGRFVSKDDFETVLQKELNLRSPDWPVYLEGDSKMEWRSAVEVIDSLQKLHAQVVLLTSRAAPANSAKPPGRTPR